MIEETVEDSVRWSPEKIIFERKNKCLQLRVESRGLPLGYTVIESVREVTSKSIPTLRKHGAQYAKRFNIKFEDRVP